jgi:hypothetical protein
MLTRYLWIILFLFTFILFLPMRLGGEEIPLTGNFRWVLGSILPDDSFQVVTDYVLKKDRPENELLLYFLPISNSYLYLFTLSSENKFKLLFPEKFNIFNKADYHYTPYEFHKVDILPFDAECPGETCMLVSTRRLIQFEKLVRAYRSAADSHKTGLFADILMELTRLHYQRYLVNAPVTPWDTGSIPSKGETAQGMGIRLTAQQYNYYFIAVFRHECE